MARPAGLEPATPGLEGRCSIQLSYGRVPSIVVERARIAAGRGIALSKAVIQMLHRSDAVAARL
jgi:hypothetical protein